MKTTIFYTVTFLALLLANSSMAMSKFILSVNCWSIDCIATAQTVKVKTRVHSKPGTRSTWQPRHQLTPQTWCVQQRLIASCLKLETLHLLRSEHGTFLYITLSL